MMIINASMMSRPITRIDKHQMARLDKIREEIMIPWEGLNQVAREVVDRDIKDVRELTVQEGRKVIEYMRFNRVILMERFRKVVWG
jgi:hypothetical protein